MGHRPGSGTTSIYFDIRIGVISIKQFKYPKIKKFKKNEKSIQFFHFFFKFSTGNLAPVRGSNRC
jgi:hypothetical protein